MTFVETQHYPNKFAIALASPKVHKLISKEGQVHCY